MPSFLHPQYCKSSLINITFYTEQWSFKIILFWGWWTTKRQNCRNGKPDVWRWQPKYSSRREHGEDSGCCFSAAEGHHRNPRVTLWSSRQVLCSAIYAFSNDHFCLLWQEFTLEVLAGGKAFWWGKGWSFLHGDSSCHTNQAGLQILIRHNCLSYL